MAANKYKNKSRNGYASKLEERRHNVLKLAEASGKISGLKYQHPIELLPKQKGKYRNERKVEYIADFVYMKDGELVVEDTKSEYTRKLPAYVIKRKLLLWVHGLSIREITKNEIDDI